MSFGKSSSKTTSTPTLTSEEKQMLAAQTDFYTGTIKPAYQQAVGGATNVYNQSIGNVNRTAQNLQSYGEGAAAQFGQYGQQALQQGVEGLSNIFNPQYKQDQMNAAMIAPELARREAMVGQNAQYGAAGSLGSARAGLAAERTSANTALQQQMARAQVSQGIETQRAQAATGLANIGLEALPAGQQAIAGSAAAAGIPLNTYNQYASVLFGTPAGSYSPEFAGTRGNVGTSKSYDFKMEMPKF